MAEPSGGMAAGIRAAPPEHSHRFGTQGRGAGERRTRWVVWITLVMMGGEIVAGLLFRSMALLADGWHMGTHAAALGVALFAYGYARRHASDPRYSFGTGKVGALGGFASAVGLAVVAVLVVGESAVRLAVPAAIRYDQALVVAVIGLLVNAGCVLLLRDGGAHAHADGAPHHHDHNLRGAYLHVLADALTSVFAIVALLAGRTLGWSWMDPAMGLLGGLVIARWAVGLLRETSSVLLDAELSEDRRARIRAALEGTGDARITDLHVWRVGPAHLAAIVSVTAAHPQPPDHYRHLLAQQHELAHVTVEVQQAPPAGP